jgi:hypothetical protein
MAFRRLSGFNNLAIDLSLSFLVALLIYLMHPERHSQCIYEKIGGFTGSTLGSFFLLFIWSWQSEHLQSSKFVRRLLQFLFWVFFATQLWLLQLVLVSGIKTSLIATFDYWSPLLLTLIWGGGVAVKCKKLFWPSYFIQKSKTLKKL